MVNMIASVDGAAAVEGTSGGLGGPGDRALFHQLRGIADVILVASGTARAESYGPARPSEAVRRARRARGQLEVPPIAVITGSLELDYTAPLFAEATTDPIVITGAEADPGRLAEARAHADVIALGGRRPDLRAALGELRRRGHRLALLEGGPSMNRVFFAEGFVDELNLSLAPALVAGDPIRIITGEPFDGPLALTLDQVVQDESYLFLRYLRAQ